MITHFQSMIRKRPGTRHPPGTQPPNGPVEHRRHHMAKWIVQLPSLSDTSKGLRQMPPAVAAADDDREAVGDLAQLVSAAKLPRAAGDALVKDIEESGAVHAQELTRDDWQQLPSWSMLKPLERRRLLKFVPA